MRTSVRPGADSEQHESRKDFWNRVIVFTSKDARLNKAHIRYVESRLIGLAREANRSEIDNGNAGSAPRLSEPDVADAEALLAEMLVIYPVPGVNAFHWADPGPARADELILRGKGTDARGVEPPDGFLVYAGSLARVDEGRQSTDTAANFGAPSLILGRW